MTLTEKLCELADRIATRIAPLGTVMIGLGSVYWAALGFGAATYVQVNHYAISPDCSRDVRDLSSVFL